MKNRVRSFAPEGQMRRLFCFFSVYLACLFIFNSAAYPQDISGLPGKHRGAITVLLRDDNGYFFSAGEDGFIGIWNNKAAVDRFQVSTSGIKHIALRPGKSHIAVAEDDGFSVHRIALWDYKTREKLFSLNLMDSVSFINFSAMGNFLIAGLGGRTGVTVINAETGGITEPLKELSERITFAATSLSEQIMICYSPSGVLSYWNLETGTGLRHFKVAPNISSPVLFGSNCFIGGFDPSGLIILDAVTGATLARDNTIRGQYRGGISGGIFIDDPNISGHQGSAQFFCLSPSGVSGTILRMEINPAGRLSVLNRIMIPPEISEIRSAASGGGNNFILANDNGELWLLNRALTRLPDSGSQELITDIAASSGALGFITESGAAGFLPLDYSRLRNGAELRLEDISVPAGPGAYTRITAADNKEAFLFWENSRTVPMLKNLQGQPPNAEGRRIFLEKLPLRFPIRSAAIFDGKILFLNTQGAISILALENGNPQFSYTAAGAQDAAFIDSNIIIAGRSAVTGISPFLAINTTTGETVNLAYPAIIGLKVYRGSGGAVYGAVVNRAAGEILTSVIRLNTQNSSLSEKIAEYDGEDSSFFLTESGGNPVFNLGGGAASIYRNQSSAKFTVERSRGLPQKAVDGGGRIIILDGEGSLCWHDSGTGKLLAVFNLYASHWTLNINGTTRSGTVVPPDMPAPDGAVRQHRTAL